MIVTRQNLPWLNCNVQVADLFIKNLGLLVKKSNLKVFIRRVLMIILEIKKFIDFIRCTVKKLCSSTHGKT